jgi:hypothetical protein
MMHSLLDWSKAVGVTRLENSFCDCAVLTMVKDVQYCNFRRERFCEG